MALSPNPLSRIKLTQHEIDYLRSFLTAGDRPGFYLAYYSMVSSDKSFGTHSTVGEDEASLQAKISSFSGDTGAAAYFSNRLLQQYAAGYTGIYLLSQSVAEHHLQAIVDNNGRLVSDQQVFASATKAWQDADLLKLFPGLLLNGQTSISVVAASLPIFAQYAAWVAGYFAINAGRPTAAESFAWIQSQTTSEVGKYVAALAGVYVFLNAETGKQVSNSSGLDLLETADGDQRFGVDSGDGHVHVVNLIDSDGAGASEFENLNSIMQLVINAFEATSPTNTLAGLTGKALMRWLISPLFSDYERGNWLDLSSPTGDPSGSYPASSIPLHKFASQASDGGETLLGTSPGILGFGGNDTLDAGKGDDAIFAGAGDDIIKGGEGDDILWGQDGTDRLEGGSGDDVLRGGDGDDTLLPGTGDDFVDGGIGQDVLDLERFGHAESDPPAPVTMNVEVIRAATTNDISVIHLNWNGNSTDVINTEYVRLTGFSDTVMLGDMGPWSSNGLGPVWGTASAPSDTNPLADLVIDFSGTLTPALGDDKIDVSNTPQHATRPGPNGTTQSTDHVGVRIDLTDAQNQSVRYRVDWGGGDIERSAVVARFQNANSVVGTDADDEIFGNSGSRVLGEGYSTLDGGKGNDLLFAGGWETHMTGGAGSDTFVAGAGEFIEDGEKSDHVVAGGRTNGILLHGGVKPIWMKANYAIPMGFGALATAFPVVGSELIATAAVFFDQVYMSLGFFQADNDGSLEINIGLGDHWSRTVLRNYQLDLDTGVGTAGLSVFSASVTEKTSAEDFRKYTNLALMAGFGTKLPNYDPIVLDLNGNGIELWTAQNSPVYRDLDLSGFAQRTGWARGGDGLLVQDLDSNGSIDTLEEMFGADGANGYAALGAYDTNHDGVINASDSGYSQLKIWVDANEDGKTDTGELMSLAAAEVASVSLSTTVTPDDAIAGSTVTGRSTFTRIDGSTGTAVEVSFTTDPTQTIYSGDDTVSTAAAALPQFLGIGRAADLRVVASHDAILLGQLQDFVATTDLSLSNLTDQAEDILLRWTRANSVAATPIGDFDAQKLAALETLAGTELAPRENGAVSDVNDAELNQLWDDTLTRFTLRLAVQGPLADIFATIDYSTDRDTLLVDNGDDLASVFDAVLTGLPSGGGAMAAWGDWAPLLSAMVGDLSWRDASGPISVDAGFALSALQAALAASGSSLTIDQLAPTLGFDHVLTGTSGNDTLARSGDGVFSFVSSGGTDTFTGGGGQDFYLIGADAGSVTITDVEANPTGDTLQFSTLNRADVTAARDGNDLVLTSTVDNTIVRVVGQFADVARGGGGTFIGVNRSIESIMFADGTLLEAGLGQISALVGTGGIGNETIVGTNGTDYLEGGKGDDTLEGGADGDFYYYNAGDGNDTISDVMSNPLVKAADMLMFGEDLAPEDIDFSRVADGDDLTITIGSGAGAATITVAGQFAYNVLGTSQAFATTNAIELFTFEAYGESYSNADLQQLLIAKQTTDGNDITYGFGSNDTFYASAGNDVLVGLDGADEYYWGTGAGNDTVDERARFIDVNVGLGGISLTDEADTVYFAPDMGPAQLHFARDYDTTNLIVTNTATGETLTVKGQFDSFQTGVLGAQWYDRVEWFAFADGSAYSWQDVEAMVTTGGAGDDRLRGDIKADQMVGGAGDDLLSGGGGGDTYLFNAGDGHDTIFDDNQDLIGDGFLTADQTIDTLQLGAGIDPGDVVFSREGSAITLTFGTSGDAVTLQGQDDYIQTGVFGAIPTSRIEQVAFDDGTIWTWQDVNEKMIAAQTTAGNDVTEGFTLADRFEKSAGDDILRGGDSGDTYVFGIGAGHDRIEESVSNVLYGDDDSVEFDSTVAVADVSVVRDGNDLILSLTSGDSLRIAGEFDLQTLYTWTDVENFRFADGTVWSKADIQHKLLQATSGADHLIGFYSDDDLDGGAGNDVLEGGDGNDTYHYDRGYGNDEIRESVTEVNVGDFDQVVFGPTLLPEDLTVARDGDDLLLTVTDTGETLRVTGQFSFANWFAWNDVELFSFANGTQWTDIDIATRLTGGTAGDDHLIGTFRSDTFDGGAGDDLMEGGDGSDIYLFGRGYGHDEIRESLSNANLGEDDEVRLGAGITLADLGFTREGDNLVISINGTDDTLTLTGEFTYSAPYTWNDVERFTFADGSYITRDQIAAIVLTGTGADEDIIGFGTSDTLDGKGGDDILEGKDGSDTYRFGIGDGHDQIIESLDDGRSSEDDTLAFKAGVAPADVTVTRDGQDAIFTLTSGDSVRVVGQFNEGYNEFLSSNDVEHVTFADGTSWDKVEIDRRSIHKTMGDDLMLGSWYQQTYDGGAGNDEIHAGSGNDVLIGGTGNDRLEGDAGDDTYIYNLGDGADTIYDYNWNNDQADKIVFGAGIAPADLRLGNNGNGNDLVVTFVGNAGSILVQSQWQGDAGVESFEFADGTIWDQAQIAAAWIAGQATSGGDTIYGSGGNDVIDGAAGNDHILPGGGGDVLTGGLGDDRLEGDAGNDTYIYNLGDGNDTIYDYNWNNDQADRIVLGAGITPANILFANNGNGSDLKITFDGNPGSILVQSQWQGDAGIESIEFDDGTVWDQNQIAARFVADQATSGDDEIYGSPFGGALDAGAGNDLVHTGDGTDTITGGAGNDRLESGGGNDLYIYNLGDGDDVIYDYNWNNDQADRIVFGAGITADDILIDAHGADGAIRITFKDAEGAILVEKQGWGDAGIEFLDFADSTTWDLTQINAHIGVATGGNDTLTADTGGSEIWALEGDDLITGSAAADSLHGQAGADAIYGKDGDDIVDGGAGDDLLFGDDDPAASRSITGSDLMVNGSFETAGTVTGSGGWGRAVSDMPGWTKANSQSVEQVYSGYAGIAATDGDYWLDMDGSGGSGSNVDISQTLTSLTDGETYRLTFDEANRTSADNGGIEVYWNGVLVVTYTASHADMQTRTIDLVAGTGDNVVRFKGLGWEDNTGSTLDNVQLHLTVANAATGGDDILTGGGGDDRIDGGAGDDLAVFTGASSDYTVALNTDGSYAVTDLVADRDGTDTLTDVETLHFSDGDVAPDDLLAGNRPAFAHFADYRQPMAYGSDFDFGGEWDWFKHVPHARPSSATGRVGASPLPIAASASALAQSIAVFGAMPAGDLGIDQVNGFNAKEMWIATHRADRLSFALTV